MAGNGGRLGAALPAVNLVALVATVALLWWRTARVEVQLDELKGAVAALQVEVAVLRQIVSKP